MVMECCGRRVSEDLRLEELEGWDVGGGLKSMGYDY